MASRYFFYHAALHPPLILNAAVQVLETSRQATRRHSVSSSSDTGERLVSASSGTDNPCRTHLEWLAGASAQGT
eukprot:2718226-Pyramimonas_sp.AAC.1